MVDPFSPSTSSITRDALYFGNLSAGAGSQHDWVYCVAIYKIVVNDILNVAVAPVHSCPVQCSI